MSFKITKFTIATFVFALFFIWLIHGVIEPWVIEISCKELVKCLPLDVGK